MIHLLLIVLVLILAAVSLTAGFFLFIDIDEGEEELKERLSDLEERNRSLKQTNEAIRSELTPEGERYSRSVSKSCDFVEDLIRFRDAVFGLKSSKEKLRKKYDSEFGIDMFREIMISEHEITSPLKRRFADSIFVGDLGLEILKGIKEGKTRDESIRKAGIPLNVGRRRVRLMKESGYLDNRLKPTRLGDKVLE